MNYFFYLVVLSGSANSTDQKVYYGFFESPLGSEYKQFRSELLNSDSPDSEETRSGTYAPASSLAFGRTLTAASTLAIPDAGWPAFTHALA